MKILKKINDQLIDIERSIGNNRRLIEDVENGFVTYIYSSLYQDICNKSILAKHFSVIIMKILKRHYPMDDDVFEALVTYLSSFLLKISEEDAWNIIIYDLDELAHDDLSVFNQYVGLMKSLVNNHVRESNSLILLASKEEILFHFNNNFDLIKNYAKDRNDKVSRALSNELSMVAKGTVASIAIFSATLLMLPSSLSKDDAFFSPAVMLSMAMLIPFSIMVKKLGLNFYTIIDFLQYDAYAKKTPEINGKRIEHVFTIRKLINFISNQNSKISNKKKIPKVKTSKAEPALFQQKSFPAPTTDALVVSPAVGEENNEVSPAILPTKPTDTRHTRYGTNLFTTKKSILEAREYCYTIINSNQKIMLPAYEVYPLIKGTTTTPIVLGKLEIYYDDSESNCFPEFKKVAEAAIFYPGSAEGKNCIHFLGNDVYAIKTVGKEGSEHRILGTVFAINENGKKLIYFWKMVDHSEMKRLLRNPVQLKAILSNPPNLKDKAIEVGERMAPVLRSM